MSENYGIFFPPTLLTGDAFLLKILIPSFNEMWKYKVEHSDKKYVFEP
jgi:hypothetical protein